MENYLANLIFLFAGWLLGLFGPWLTELLQRPFRRAQIRRSLFVELKELRFKFAAMVYLLACHNETIDRTLLGWAFPILKADKSVSAPWFMESEFRKLLDLGDAQLKAFSLASKELGVGCMPLLGGAR